MSHDHGHGEAWTPEDKEALAVLLREHSVRTGSFQLASGETSSVYCDVKKTSLRSDGAKLLGRGLLHLASRCQAEAVGGLTLGADPLVTAISLSAALAGGECPAIIVRKQTKGHGTQNRLETPGGLPEGACVVAVDDVVTTAGSTLQAIEALRAGGFRVEDAICVVDRESSGKERLAEHGVRLHAIFVLSELVEL